MNQNLQARQTSACKCLDCPGAGCTCGCQGASAAPAACNCGAACRCEGAEQGCLCE